MTRSDCCGSQIVNNKCITCGKFCGSHRYIHGETPKNKTFADYIDFVYNPKTTNFGDIFKEER